MESFAKEITTVDIEEELKRSYLDYAMSVIVERALPDVRDGLKPVHRRILYAMWVLKNDWNKPYKKSSRIVGDAIGKYHPHGDTAVYDAIVRMAQEFSLRYKLIDGQGNFGSVDGDSAAAMRYTEIRLSKISHEILSDLTKSTVDFVPNYDNTETIPDVMPSKVPNLLINGSSGIAVGMATNIPPHNLYEVINGCLACAKNENIDTADLMRHIPGPDFPTRALINGTEGIKKAYSTGKGKIRITSKVKTETHGEDKRERIVVQEIPYQVNKTKLIEKIADLSKTKRIDGINSLRDESDKDGMRIVVEVKRGVNSQAVLNRLYSLTPLQISFGINMVALDQGKPKIFSLKQIILSFLEHRKNVITKRTLFDLRQVRNRMRVLEALEIAHVNIEDIVTLVRRSTTTRMAKTTLMSRSWDVRKILLLLEKFNFSLLKKMWFQKSKLCNNGYSLDDSQSEAILCMRLSQMTRLEIRQLADEHQQLSNQFEMLTKILECPKFLNEVLCRELIDIRDAYRDKRRTQISSQSPCVRSNGLVHKENVVVTLSYHGYVKYQLLSDYEFQHRGGRGKSAVRTKDKDFVYSLLVANTHDNILLFSTRGRVYWLKVHQIPLFSRIAKGKPIINLLPLKTKERITAMLSSSNHQKNQHVFMVTARGIVKKTSLAELNRPRNSGLIALHLNAGDRLVGVDFTDGSNEVMLFSASGKVVRFSEDQVRSMGRTATGVKGISLSSGDRVVSLIVPDGTGSILTVTKNGYGKRTELSEYPVNSRAKKGVIAIKINRRNGKVVGSVQVEDSDQIMLITNQGTLVRIKVMEANLFRRNTQGVKLIRVLPNKHVVGVQRIMEPVVDA